LALLGYPTFINGVFREVNVNTEKMEEYCKGLGGKESLLCKKGFKYLLLTKGKVSHESLYEIYKLNKEYPVIINTLEFILLELIPKINEAVERG